MLFEFKRVVAERDKLKAENETLRSALQWIWDHRHDTDFSFDDYVRTAQRALIETYKDGSLEGE